MKTYILIFLLVFTSLFVMATHNKGGEITYQHISGFTYEIIITTYTQTSGTSIQADRPVLDSVVFGDGTSSSFTRISFVDLAGDHTDPNNTRVNTYLNTHTYATEGVYTIGLVDFNRNAGIINIPNSVNVPFSIQSDIVVYDPSAYCVNNSCVPSSLPIFLSVAGVPYTYNLAASDPDGDSLSFELVPCNSGLNSPIFGYSYPTGMTINSMDGEINWGQNNTLGTYNVAVKISEWRHQIKVGSVTSDFEIIVFPSSDTYLWGNTNTIPADTAGNFLMNVLPGNFINLSFYFADPTSPSIALGFLEENFSSNSPIVTVDTTVTHIAQVTFQWTPNSSQARNNPYIFVFRGTTNESGTPLEHDLSLMVFVNGIHADSCPAFPNFYTLSNDFYFTDLNLKIFPNPSQEKITIFVNSKWHENNELNFDLYDLLGNKIKSFRKISSGFQFSMKDFSSGIYIYKCSTCKGNLVSSGKLIKE